MRIRRYSQATGFTLLEVLVALAIISIALIAIIKTAGTVVGNTRYLQEKTFAHWIALDRLAELRAERAWPSRGTVQDDIENMGQRWRWIQKTIEAPDKNLRQVDISVLLDEGDDDFPLITMTGFLVNPLVNSFNPSDTNTSNANDETDNDNANP